MAASAWNLSLVNNTVGHLMFAVIGAKGLTLEKPSEFFVRPLIPAFIASYTSIIDSILQ